MPMTKRLTSDPCCRDAAAGTPNDMPGDMPGDCTSEHSHRIAPAHENEERASRMPAAASASAASSAASAAPAPLAACVTRRGPDAAPDADTSTDGVNARPRVTDGLLDAIAAGRHDDALVRQVADHLAQDAESVLWSDARFVAWWGEEMRARAAAEARRRSDAAFLAAGRALQARVTARRLGVAVRHEPPPLRPAAVVTVPGRSIDEAADVGATPWVDLAVAAGVGRELWDEPGDTWLELPADVRARRWGERFLALRIAGDSMAPALDTGDTVLVALGATPRMGAAVVARHPDDGYVCKRVRRVRAATLELESLAPGRPVITLPRNAELVLGIVVAAWRSADRRQPRRD